MKEYALLDNLLEQNIYLFIYFRQSNKMRSNSTGRLGLRRKGLHIDELGLRHNVTAFRIIKQHVHPDDEKHLYIPVDDDPRNKKFVKIFKPDHLPPLEEKDKMDKIDRIIYERLHPTYERQALIYKRKHGVYGYKKIEEEIPDIFKRLAEKRQQFIERYQKLLEPRNKYLALKLGQVRAPRDNTEIGKFVRSASVCLLHID